MLSRVCRASLKKVAIGSRHYNSNADAVAFGYYIAFGALFCPVGGVWPWFFSPPKGALVIAPSILRAISSRSSAVHHRQAAPTSRTARRLSPPSILESAGALQECLQMPVPFSAPHWQPVRSTKRIAFIAAQSGVRGLWQPSGCGLPGGRNSSISCQSSSGTRQPSSLMTSPIELFQNPRPSKSALQPLLGWALRSCLVKVVAGSGEWGEWY